MLSQLCRNARRPSRRTITGKAKCESDTAFIVILTAGRECVVELVTDTERMKQTMEIECICAVVSHLHGMD